MRKEHPLPAVADLPRLNAAQLQAVHRLIFDAEHAIVSQTRATKSGEALITHIIIS